MKKEKLKTITDAIYFTVLSHAIFSQYQYHPL